MSAPINTSGTPQIKTGGFTVGSLITAGSATVGSLNAGSGAISTTGTFTSGAATVGSLSAGSGAISTTGSISGGGITANRIELANKWFLWDTGDSWLRLLNTAGTAYSGGLAANDLWAGNAVYAMGAGNAVYAPNGNVSANDYYSSTAGKWMSTLQSRVTGSCSVGQSITTINADGTVVCGPGGIGVGQTWQNFTSARALNTTYTNSTGKPIMIAVHSSCSAAITGLRLWVDSVWVQGYDGWTNGSGTCSIAYVSGIIPNGATYRVTSNNGSFFRWGELR